MAFPAASVSSTSGADHTIPNATAASLVPQRPSPAVCPRVATPPLSTSCDSPSPCSWPTSPKATPSPGHPDCFLKRFESVASDLESPAGAARTSFVDSYDAAELSASSPPANAARAPVFTKVYHRARMTRSQAYERVAQVRRIRAAATALEARAQAPISAPGNAEGLEEAGALVTATAAIQRRSRPPPHRALEFFLGLRRRAASLVPAPTSASPAPRRSS